MWLLKNNRVWFLAFPLGIAVLVWGPYLLWNVWHGELLWWRIPIVSATFFDTSAYLQWLGQTINGLDISNHLRWFEYPLRALGRLMPDASVSEVWLLSRWISITAVLFVSAWAVRTWTGLDVARSRFAALALWLSFMLACGMRPGAFSWYLPFGIFGLVAPLIVMRRLRERSFVAAAVWTIVTVFATSVYVWFFIVSVIWLASIWGVWLLHRSRAVFYGSVLACTTLALLVAWKTAVWLTSTASGRLFWDLQVQDGIGFTHFPQVTNPFVAMIFWIVFLLVAARSLETDALIRRADRFLTIQWVWLALLMAWLITPFTGVYIHNDHFRTPVIIMSWMSLALVWSFARAGDMRFSKKARWTFLGIFAVSILFILNIVRQPYAFNHDYLNVLHFSVWFTVAMAAWLVMRRGVIRVPMAWPIILLFGSIVIGGLAAADIYAREYMELSNRMRYVPVISWIRDHVPASDGMCANPGQAELLASFTGRRVFPSNASAISKKRIVDGLRTTRAYASGFDAAATGDASYIGYVNYFGRRIICEQFTRQAAIIRAMGVSEDRINAWSGCPADLLKRLDEMTDAMLRQPEVDAPAFQEACPWVIVSSAQRSHWRLPDDYRETRIDDFISVWHAEP